MNALTRDKVLRWLKDAPQTATVRVRCTDEDVRELSRGGPKTPWKPILAALDELPWQSAELLDKRGALIGDAAATELENLPALSSRVTEVGQLSQIVQHSIRGMSELIAAQTKPAFDALTTANRDAHELVDLHRQRADAAEQKAAELEAKYHRLVERLRATQERMTAVTEDIQEAAARVQAEGDKSLIDQLPQIATAVTQLAPLVRGLLGAGSSPPAAPAMKVVK
jgi:hypothetical protein